MRLSAKWIALALCVFLGMFGVHRFYVGKIGTGVLWFFTAGMCGIGWMVDIFTIAVSAFYDNNGYVLRDGGGQQVVTDREVNG